MSDSQGVRQRLLGTYNLSPELFILSTKGWRSFQLPCSCISTIECRIYATAEGLSTEMTSQLHDHLPLESVHIGGQLQCASSLLAMDQYMHNRIHRDTKSQHACYHAETFQILWFVLRWEQIRSVYLREIAHCVDECQCYCSHLGRHGSEGR